MEAIPLSQILLVLLVSTIGLTCLYTFISMVVFYWSLSSLKFDKIRNFIFLLFIIILIGFLYALWNFLNLVGIIVIPEFNRDILNTLFVTHILVLIIYMSFSVRNLGQTKVSKKKMLSDLMSKAAERGSKIRL